MRYLNPADPTYAPNSYGGPVAKPELFGTDPSWWVAGEIMRSAYEPRRDDNDFIQPGTLGARWLDDASVASRPQHRRAHPRRAGGAGAVPGHRYWRSVDSDLGAGSQGPQRRLIPAAGQKRETRKERTMREAVREPSGPGPDAGDGTLAAPRRPPDRADGSKLLAEFVGTFTLISSAPARSPRPPSSPGRRNGAG